MLKKRTIGSTLLIITAAMALLLAVSAPAMAGLRVAGTPVYANIPPGESGSGVITVTNTDAERSIEIAVDVRGLGTYLSGAINILQPGADLSPYTGRGYVSASPSSFHLEPGQSQAVTVTIDLPEDVGDGGRYAVVFIHTVPSGGGAMPISAAVASQVYITVDGSSLVRSGDLTALEMAPPLSQQPFSVSATVLNTGNYHYKLAFSGAVKNSQGQTVGETLSTTSIYTLIPTFSQKVEQIPFNIYSDLPAGLYTVEVEARTQEGVFLDSGTVQFSLSDTYRPVPVRTLTTQLFGASASWAMSEDGTLLENVNAVSLDGTVSIFLQSGTKALGPDGLPLASMEVTSVSPSPPSGYELVSAFRFDPGGATFDPDARITIKYSQDDIPRGVNENRLTVATLDTTTLQWDFIGGQVDAAANTITFSTGHFSVYAVLSPPASASMSIWMWTGIALAFIAAVCLIYVIFKRRQGKQPPKKRKKTTPAPAAGAGREVDYR